MPEIRIALDDCFVFGLRDQILLWVVDPLSVTCVFCILMYSKILVSNKLRLTSTVYFKITYIQIRATSLWYLKPF